MNGIIVQSPLNSKTNADVLVGGRRTAKAVRDRGPDRYTNMTSLNERRSRGDPQAGADPADPIDAARALTGTLPSAIGDRLRVMIIEGALAPGTRLNER
ncbi:MAG: hypothetical protein ABI593_00560, partial [Betaproteobacteria bacterium]